MTRTQTKERGAVPRLFVDSLETVESLLWPVQCAGCGLWDVEICEDCKAVVFNEPLDLVLEDSAGIPTWPLIALGEYDSVLRDMILAAKHDQQRDMSGFLISAGRELGKACEPLTSELLSWESPRSGTGIFHRVWLVPAPSSHRRRRRRAEVVPHIVAGMKEGLETALGAASSPPVRVSVVPAVALEASGGGTAGMGARGRGLGRAGSMKLTRHIPPRTLLIVADDVTTTGATLREMLRVLPDSALFGAVVAAAP